MINQRFIIVTSTQCDTLVCKMMSLFLILIAVVSTIPSSSSGHRESDYSVFIPKDRFSECHRIALSELCENMELADFCNVLDFCNFEDEQPKSTEKIEEVTEPAPCPEKIVYVFIPLDPESDSTSKPLTSEEYIIRRNMWSKNSEPKPMSPESLKYFKKAVLAHETEDNIPYNVLCNITDCYVH
ncbi:uncharacterized protein [Fopius arisanus]|uniref:Uncharacterized protein n=1 Tax=Fopius arisanus TaxID=64838 RepID=A0A9R1U2B4_9HYME|nr:PREDICTED: uncharacterized protein LOC105268092 [Fopius arisanus]